MRKVLRGMLCVFVLFVLFISTPVFASSFSADMFWRMEGKGDRTGKFYMSDHLYRFDTTDKGQRLRFIVDRKTGKAKVLNLDQKIYFELKNNDMMILMSNPFEAHFAMTSMYKVATEGEEEINGIVCEKKTLTMNGSVVQRAWISRKYQFPIKLVNYKGRKEHMSVELKNIKEVHVDRKLFEPPGDFKMIRMSSKGKKRLPKWLARVKEKVPGAQILEPPFKHAMRPGDIIRVRYRDGMVISFKATGKNLIQYLAFRDGEFVKSLGTFGGRKEARFSSLPDGANEIIVNAREGNFTLRAEIVSP